MGKSKFNIWSLVVTLVIGMIMYFFFLPPINVTSIELWIFVMILLFL